MAEAPKPYVWIIPGDDICSLDGWIDAMAWEDGEFSKPLYDDAALARARADALEEALAAIALWQSPPYTRLHAGEMTVQEMRSVQAVLGGIASRIRALNTGETDGV